MATATRLAAIARPVLAAQSCPSSVSEYDGPGPGPLFQYVQACAGIVNPMSPSPPVISLMTWCAPSSLPVTTTPATRL